MLSPLDFGSTGAARACYRLHDTQGSAYAPPWAKSNVTPLGFKSGALVLSMSLLRNSHRSAAQLRITLSWRGMEPGSRRIIKNRLPSGEIS